MLKTHENAKRHVLKFQVDGMRRLYSSLASKLFEKTQH